MTADDRWTNGSVALVLAAVALALAIGAVLIAVVHHA
jgi:hypothetical protein